MENLLLLGVPIRKHIRDFFAICNYREQVYYLYTYLQPLWKSKVHNMLKNFIMVLYAILRVTDHTVVVIHTSAFFSHDPPTFHAKQN